VCVRVCVWIYIYTHICIHICRERERERVGTEGGTRDKHEKEGQQGRRKRGGARGSSPTTCVCVEGCTRAGGGYSDLAE